MSEIEGIDPLTTGQVMYDEEDIKGSRISSQIVNKQVEKQGTVPSFSLPKSKVRNRSKNEQDAVAKGRKEL